MTTTMPAYHHRPDSVRLGDRVVCRWSSLRGEHILTGRLVSIFGRHAAIALDTPVSFRGDNADLRREVLCRSGEWFTVADGPELLPEHVSGTYGDAALTAAGLAYCGVRL